MPANPNEVEFTCANLTDWLRSAERIASDKKAAEGDTIRVEDDKIYIQVEDV